MQQADADVADDPDASWLNCILTFASGWDEDFEPWVHGDFFAGEGLSHEQIQRGLTGDAEAGTDLESWTDGDGMYAPASCLALLCR